MHKFFAIFLTAVMLSACISTHQGGGVQVQLYTWDDRSNPLTTRSTLIDTFFDGVLTGDVLFSSLLEQFPNLDRGADTPYLLELCQQDPCLYSVVFPAYLTDKEGTLQGFGTINALTTTFYNDVQSLPAGSVREALDALAQQTLSAEVESFNNADGSVDYRDIFALDYTRFSNYLDLLLDPTLADRASTALTVDSTTTVSSLLGLEPQSALLTAWIVNDTGQRSNYIYEDNSTTRVLVNVASVTQVGSDYVRVSASGIPAYPVTMTAELLAWLNARPKAATDFVGGQVNATLNRIVSFGQDIGYNSNSSSCGANAGFGYWPPGPECPSNQDHLIDFPLEPQPGATACETGAGSVGYYVNGTSVFNWTDAQSYQSQGVWHTLAPVAEVYDVDICGGHAANGEYHHHFYSDCLAELVGDEGTGHSPIYGFAADGYPIYGPYQENGQLARSSWVARDYDTPGASSGCGSTGGGRSCLLVDQYDLAAGVVAASSAGPDTDDSYTSMSQNQFSTESGFFFEDYYWDPALASLGDEWLDQYNGHSDDSRGYHYHVTIESDGDALTPAFPYSVGPRFAGELQSNASASCSTGTSGGGGGGGGTPPPGGPGGMAPPGG